MGERQDMGRGDFGWLTYPIALKSIFTAQNILQKGWYPASVRSPLSSGNFGYTLLNSKPL